MQDWEYELGGYDPEALDISCHFVVIAYMLSAAFVKSWIYFFVFAGGALGVCNILGLRHDFILIVFKLCFSGLCFINLEEHASGRIIIVPTSALLKSSLQRRLQIACNVHQIHQNCKKT